MAFISADRVKETTETTGTGAITLAGAAAGFRSFASVMSAADTCHYCIVGNNEWEVGLGTYNTTLARTSVIASSNANNLVNFSAGTKDVFITLNKQTIEEYAGGAWGDITGTLADQTDLQAALNAKANSSHSHAISDVTGLQAALDGKQASGSYAAASHSHAISDVTNLQTSLDAKVDEGAVTSSGLTMSTDKLLGRDTAGAGAIEELSVGGGLSIASGTLSVSSAGGILSGTSFPVSPTTGDVFRRTDRQIEYYYNGTRWLSTQIFTLSQDCQGALVPSTATFSIFSVNPWWNLYDMWLEEWSLTTLNALATPASNYFTCELFRRDGSTSASISTPISTQNDAQNTYIGHRQTLGVLLDKTNEAFQVACTETGAQSLTALSVVTYRLVG